MMADQLCGYSTGEGLSRWAAMIVSNNALSDFATVPAWIESGYQDWVTETEPTDQDDISIGCSMAFISWLLSLEFTIEERCVELELRRGLCNFVIRPLRASGLHVPNHQAAVLALVDVIDPSLHQRHGCIDDTSDHVLDADGRSLDVRCSARQVCGEHPAGECVERFQTFSFGEL
jgi:hypothetical protein